MDEAVSDIAALLRKRIGLNPDSVRGSAIADAVRARMDVVGDRGTGDYLARLCQDGEEFAELIEQIVVPETWFFRDVQPFVCVREFVKQLPAGQPLRLLSVPCSSGEEAYSLAIVLLDMGLSPSRFRVEGVDVSRRLLRLAEEAVYPASSFREAAAEFVGLRERYSRRAGTGFAIDETVRQTVGFRPGNLASADFRPTLGPYHIVFCRHLLIYLDADARRTALANLRRATAPGGLLYLGHVEAAVAREGGFRSYHRDYPAAFVSGSEPAPRAPAPATRPVKSKPKPPRAVPPTLSESLLPEPVAPPATQTPPTLAAAKQAADGGRLTEAAALCETLLQGRPSADIFCLLGVVRQALGDLVAAEQNWRKALYVDSRHQESLVHLELLARSRGDDRQANLLRKRAGRAAGEEEAS